MDRLNPFVGQPIRSMQNFLRKIGTTYNNIPIVVPDGVFGEQTREAVLGFQIAYNLPLTGEINYDTWKKIIDVHLEIVENEAEPRLVRIYPGIQATFMPGDASVHLLPIQAVLHALSQVFDNIDKLEINGTHDEKSVNVVKGLQNIFGMEQSGVIDKKFWNHATGMYEAHISNNRFQQQP